VLSGRGLGDELITRPEESYRLWCITVCDLETSRMRPWPALGHSATGKIFVIISPNVISILLHWDGLGLVSYSLVIYYQNVRSYGAGMSTVLSNQITCVAGNEVALFPTG